MKKGFHAGITVATMAIGAICLPAGCGKKDDAMHLVGGSVNERVQDASQIADYDTAEQNGISYYFEAGVLSEEDRTEFVKKTDAFYCKIRELQEGGENTETGYSVYVGDSLTTQGTFGKAFIQTQDVQSYRGMTAVLCSAMTETVNYGQAYGIAAFLCEDIKMTDLTGQPADSDEELAEYYENEENLCLLDFFLPVFEPVYVDETTVAYAQAAAVSFEKYYINRVGLETAFEMCAESAKAGEDIPLEKEKNEWLEEIGANVSYCAAQYVIPFVHNLSDDRAVYPYLVFTDDTIWYPALVDVELIGYSDFVSGFADVLQYQETDFAEAKEALRGYIDSEIPPVAIYTDFADDSDTSQTVGAFYMANHIKLFHGWTISQANLLHEYVHYLTMKHGLFETGTGFFAEGIADEIAYMECDNRLMDLYWNDVLTEEDEALWQQYQMWDDEYDTVNDKLREMLEGVEMYLGYTPEREYLSTDQTVLTRSAEMAETLKPNQLTYAEAAGMIAYLIETYGKDTVYANCRDTNGLEAVYGKTFLELYNEWGEWNIRKCEEAGIDIEVLKNL